MSVPGGSCVGFAEAAPELGGALLGGSCVGFAEVAPELGDDCAAGRAQPVTATTRNVTSVRITGSETMVSKRAFKHRRAEGATQDAGMLVVANTITPKTYEISAPAAGTCLAMGISF